MSDELSVKNVQEKCDAYFTQCINAGTVFGEAGLALYLNVTLDTLRQWFDDSQQPERQKVIQMAYLRIQDQYESSAAYLKQGMSNRALFFLRKTRFGGDPPAKCRSDSNAKEETEPVQLIFGENMDASDFM